MKLRFQVTHNGNTPLFNKGCVGPHSHLESRKSFKMYKNASQVRASLTVNSTDRKAVIFVGGLSQSLGVYAG